MDSEWIGGCLIAPFFVTDRPTPYRPIVVFWAEFPDGVVLAHQIAKPENTKGALGRTLRDAIEQPLVGKPRFPTRIRVATAELAAEVRAVVGPRIAVTVAPTPELDEILDLMRETMPGDDTAEESYLEEGRLGADTIGALFEAADVLYRTAPWKHIDEDQVLHVDIPALRVRGACLSTLGTLGEVHGFALFPSIDAYDRFVDASMDERRENAPRDFGTPWLVLCFEPAKELPARMRREAASHGWRVSSPAAYPVVAHRDRDGTPRPLAESDIRIATACAQALATFAARHRGDQLDDEGGEPICESFRSRDGLVVRVTYPYEAAEFFDTEETVVTSRRSPAQPRVKIGRNDPCPCGSGKKYKKCCERSVEESSPASIHELDRAIVADIDAFAVARFGGRWHRLRFQLKHDDDEGMLRGLLDPWRAYNCSLERRRILDWYLDSRSKPLPAEARAWIEAQRSAWPSIWEVSDVEPGRGMTLRDLLTGEVRRVRESGASRSVIRRDVLLARVVEHEGIAVLCGTHPLPLPPGPAAQVLSAVRARLRLKREVLPARLQNEAISRCMIEAWNDAVDEMKHRAAIPPVLHNTDGDLLVIVLDRFDIAASAHDALRSHISQMDGVRAPEADTDDPSFDFVRENTSADAPLENTLIGSLRISGDELRLEANSIERADALRSRIESACTGLVRHRSREQTDPYALKGKGSPETKPHPLPRPLPPEAAELVKDLTARHYARWPDMPLPALGGKTPRQAARSAHGRAKLGLLLKEMEHSEGRQPPESRFDFATLRRELGLES